MEVVPVTVPRCQTCIRLFSTMTTVVRNPYWGVNPSETFTWEHCRRTRNIIGIVFILRFWELNKRYNWDKRVLSSLVFIGKLFLCGLKSFVLPSAFSFCLLSNSIHGVGCHAAQWPTAYRKLPILLPNADFPILRYRVVALLCLIFSTPDLYTHWSGLPLDSNQSGWEHNGRPQASMDDNRRKAFMYSTSFRISKKYNLFRNRPVIYNMYEIKL